MTDSGNQGVKKNEKSVLGIRLCDKQAKNPRDTSNFP